MRKPTRKWIYRGIFLAVLIPTGYGGMRVLSEMEKVDGFFPDRRAAELGYALGMGWLHDSLPKSARNIYESHNLDSNICGPGLNSIRMTLTAFQAYLGKSR